MVRITRRSLLGTGIAITSLPFISSAKTQSDNVVVLSNTIESDWAVSAIDDNTNTMLIKSGLDNDKKILKSYDYINRNIKWEYNYDDFAIRSYINNGELYIDGVYKGLYKLDRESQEMIWQKKEFPSSNSGIFFYGNYIYHPGRPYKRDEPYSGIIEKNTGNIVIDSGRQNWPYSVVHVDENNTILFEKGGDVYWLNHEEGPEQIQTIVEHERVGAHPTHDENYLFARADTGRWDASADSSPFYILNLNNRNIRRLPPRKHKEGWLYRYSFEYNGGHLYTTVSYNSEKNPFAFWESKEKTKPEYRTIRKYDSNNSIIWETDSDLVLLTTTENIVLALKESEDKLIGINPSNGDYIWEAIFEENLEIPHHYDIERSILSRVTPPPVESATDSYAIIRVENTLFHVELQSGNIKWKEEISKVLLNYRGLKASDERYNIEQEVPRDHPYMLVETPSSDAAIINKNNGKKTNIPYSGSKAESVFINTPNKITEDLFIIENNIIVFDGGTATFIDFSMGEIVWSVDGFLSPPEKGNFIRYGGKFGDDRWYIRIYSEQKNINKQLTIIDFENKKYARKKIKVEIFKDKNVFDKDRFNFPHGHYQIGRNKVGHPAYIDNIPKFIIRNYSGEILDEVEISGPFEFTINDVENGVLAMRLFEKETELISIFEQEYINSNLATPTPTSTPTSTPSTTTELTTETTVQDTPETEPKSTKTEVSTDGFTLVGALVSMAMILFKKMADSNDE